MAHVLVIGASQGVGLETVKVLISEGHRVRALARSADKIPIDDPGLEKFAGNALSRDDVARALDGVDSVVLALGIGRSASSLQTLMRGTDLFSRATRILVDLMRERGPRRLVVVTGLGAGDSRGRFGFVYDGLVFPIFLKRIYDDKDIQERMVRDSGLDWTIARPGILVTSPVSGRYRALDDPRQWEFKTIARADVARFVADELRDGKFLLRTPLIIQ